jgi:hypothetical protein
MCCTAALCVSSIVTGAVADDMPDSRPVVEYVNATIYRIKHVAQVDNHDATRIKSLELAWGNANVAPLRRLRESAGRSDVVACGLRHGWAAAPLLRPMH